MMKFLVSLCFFFCLVIFCEAGHHGISIGIPLPFIKLRFVDIAQLFGHEGGHGGHGGYGGGHGGGLSFGLHGGHGGY
ncbi:hypothetical protein CDAR_516671 [Caerostris darwini]|uniref:Uncharacterized protein n=1 Tax=Caerostris darwini TaxID=1538125 RepID=A0AAV4WWS9_9ARAC|nr:hypothetical protein CDAR_516671 [Caerostris darwini]